MDNASNRSGAPSVFSPVDEDQEAYDQLDPRIRLFIQHAPEKLSAAWALRTQKLMGADALLEGGLKMIKTRYPDFVWPKDTF